MNTGRACDGYESPFRILTRQHLENTHAGGIKSDLSLQTIRPTFIEITPQDVFLLNRYFSTKTLFDVKLDCNGEAREVLQASLKDLPIRHAVLSLRALREDLETSGDNPASVTKQTPIYHYGLQQYSLALRGLASNLSSISLKGLKSTLLCCQILISIEQVRKDYAAMGQHIIRGLRIMYEFRARPVLVAMNKLAPANHEQIPLLDVFIIKLFAAPCKFAEALAAADTSGTTLPVCLISPQKQPTAFGNLRTIVPDNRTELLRIAMLTLEFLGKVSEVKSVQIVLRLLLEKATLLESLDSWLVDLDLNKTKIEPLGSELISVTFLRFFHLILKVVLLGALESSPDLDAKLEIENNRLQHVASNVGERVKNYITCSGTSSGRADRSTIH